MTIEERVQAARKHRDVTPNDVAFEWWLANQDGAGVVKKLEGEKGWSISAEEAIRRELNEVVVKWMEASNKMVGPIEVTLYLKSINQILMTSRLDENPDLSQEQADKEVFRDAT